MMGSMMRRAALGDGSTLSLDFTTGVLDPRLTFTRSTSGTYIGADGLVKTATTNTARFDHDPTAIGTPRGLLIEGSANNLAFYSEYINPNAAPWNVYWFFAGAGASVTPVSQADPAGGTTASRCILGTSGSGRVYNGISTTAGVTYTLSFWARSVSGTTSLAFWHFNSATGNSTAVTINTSWQRYQVTILGRTLGGFVECGIANTTANAATVDLWGLQFETGSGASSYIPSGASQGSRAFDSCVMEDITSCNYSTKTGTLFYAGRFTQMNASSFPNRFGFTRETGDLRAFYALSTTTALLPGYSNGGTSVLTTQNITLNSELKLAISFDADLSTAEVKSSLNGAAIVQSVASALTESNAPTYFMLGQKGYGAFFPHGTVRSVKYWPTTLPTDQLQSLTTL